MKRGLRAPRRALGRTCGLIILVALARAGDTPRGPEGFADVRAKIARLVEDRTIPSLSLSVVRDGAIVWEEVFGAADLEKKIPSTTETTHS